MDDGITPSRRGGPHPGKGRNVMNAWRLFLCLGPLALTACEGMGRGGETVVARAGDAELSAQEVAAILAPETRLPAQTRTVEALADLWLDYVLLTLAAAEDTTLGNVDVSPLVQRQMDQELRLRLRDQVVQVDTTVTDEEIETLYYEELPGAEVRARHILLRFPSNASRAQRDSVRALAESLRDRIDGGEDFEALARNYSQDRGSASRGGDLGTFAKGEMVAPFEEAAFALEPGEVSQPVETDFGIHLIRVEERSVPSLEEGRDRFRARIRDRRVAEAESVYVAALVDSARLEVVREGFEGARRLLEDPGIPLTPRAAGRSLVRFEGGAYTLGEFRRWVQSQGPALQEEARGASDQELGDLLRNLARGKLLARAARERGLTVDPAREDSLRLDLLNGLRSVARQLNVLDLEPQEGETIPEAAERVVHDILVRVVRDQQEVFPLGAVSYLIREEFGGELVPAALPVAVRRVREIRTRGPDTLESPPPPPPDDSGTPASSSG